MSHKIDELKVYRGKDFVINEYLKISQKTLGEICDFGEKEYFGYVSTFCATPSDMMIELEQSGIDFVKIGDLCVDEKTFFKKSYNHYEK